jgi:hypothetical protein
VRLAIAHLHEGDPAMSRNRGQTASDRRSSATEERSVRLAGHSEPAARGASRIAGDDGLVRQMVDSTRRGNGSDPLGIVMVRVSGPAPLRGFYAGTTMVSTPSLAHGFAQEARVGRAPPTQPAHGVITIWPPLASRKCPAA